MYLSNYAIKGFVMQKVLGYLISGVKVLDKIAYCILFLNIFFLFFAVFRFDLLGTDVSKYTNLNLAKKNIDIIFNLLCLQSILFVLKNKYPKIVNIEIILWILMFLLIPYFIYQIPSIQQAYNFGA